MRLLVSLYRFFWKRYRTCWRKVTHDSHGSAAREAKRLRNGVHAYQCPYCHAWHVGHSSFSKK